MIIPFNRLFIWLALVLSGLAQCGIAADSEFVGILSLAIEDDVANQLGLSKAVQRELTRIVDDRESEALDLALSLRDLSTKERDAKFLPFRRDSEKQGLKLLSKEQRLSLRAIQLSREGMSSLAQNKLALQLKLTAEQKKQVAELLAARDDKMNAAGNAEAKRIRANYERQLKAVLNPEQLLAWNGITKPSDQSEATTTRDQAVVAGKPQGKKTNNKTFFGKAQRKTNETPNETVRDTIRFSFRFAPWGDVIEWFADQSDLSLLMDAPPQGTFNYSDPREYTPAQAIDLLNSVLLTKGYTLVRREQMLMVINLEDGIPPNLITDVPVDKLDTLGEYELSRCIFTLQAVDAESAAEEIRRLVGPQGKVDVLVSSNQISITETAGRLRSFRKILEAGEKKNQTALGKAELISLEHVRSSDILKSWQKLMGLAEDQFATEDGNIRVTKGKSSKQLLVSGDPHRVKEVRDLVSLLDVPAGLGSARDVPQLEVYPVTEADPESVLSVMQELFAGADEIRLATDPKTGSLVALATADEHATIRATITQMQRDRRQMEVIRLRTVDPQLAMLSIEKLFGPSGEEEAPDPNAPRVDADPTTRSLLIRATEAQIQDIRSLLAKMGEQESGNGTGGGFGGRGSGNLRMIPIDAATARRTLEQLNSIWPTVRQNRIRTVRPSSSIRGFRSDESSAPPASTSPSVPLKTTGTEATTAERSIYVANEQEPEVNEEDAANAQTSTTETLPDVIVTIGPQGLLIASEDTEALDEFEGLFMTLADQLFAGTREMAVFYLKFAKADVAAEVLKQFIGGGTSSSGGGGTLLGSLAGAALGNSGVGSMLGLGGSGSTAKISSGTTVIADPRLNAVVVQATPKELDFIEDLLKVLDKSNSPEQIATIPRPRAIPVINTDAEAIAEIVRSVYASRLAGGGTQQRQPSPEDFMRAISGQKNPGRSIQDAIREQVQLTISVDQRRNALLVVAPDSLFEEIKTLVADLDFATPELSETIRYGRAGGSSPDMIRDALSTIIGEDAVTSESNAKPSSNTKKKNSGQNDKPQQPGFEEMRRRMDFFRSIQQRAAKERAISAKKAAGKGRGK